MNLLLALSDQLSRNPRCGNTHVIAIDGRAGAGKTTLALELFLAFSLERTVSVIHLDEIYDGWDGALSVSLTQKLKDLLTTLSLGEPATLRIFDWSAEAFTSVKVVLPTEIVIIEGVGSAQAAVRTFATATIWLDVTSTEGLSRVLERDGQGIASEMIRWQMQEEAHFNTDQTRENSDYILSTS